MDIATETWTASVIVGKSSIFKTVIDQKSQYLWKSFKRCGKNIIFRFVHLN